MGVHTGQAVASGGRYTGLAVHRAARIGAAGHGGQILVSQATQTLVEDEEEDLHIHLQDLGEQRLKDLDRPVRLYQAAADGLPTEFLPLRPDAELAPVAPVVPFWRRPATIAAAAVGAALVVAAIAALLLRGGEASVAVRANSVAVVDPDNGRVVDDIQVGTRPGPITFGAGSIWVGNLDDRTVTRIDVAAERTVLRNIPLEDRTPTGLAFGFGAVWVAHGLRGQVSRIDPQFNEPSQPIQVVDAGLGGSSERQPLRPVRTRSGPSSATRPWRESTRIPGKWEETRAGADAGRHRRRQRLRLGLQLGPGQGVALQPHRVPRKARSTNRQRGQAADRDRGGEGDLGGEHRGRFGLANRPERRCE